MQNKKHVIILVLLVVIIGLLAIVIYNQKQPKGSQLEMKTFENNIYSFQYNANTAVVSGADYMKITLPGETKGVQVSIPTPINTYTSYGACTKKEINQKDFLACPDKKLYVYRAESADVQISFNGLDESDLLSGRYINLGSLKINNVEVKKHLGSVPGFAYPLINKGVDQIYKYSYQGKTYYYTTDWEVVGADGQSLVYNTDGVRVAGCGGFVPVGTPSDPLCPDISKAELIYNRK